MNHLRQRSVCISSQLLGFLSILVVAGCGGNSGATPTITAITPLPTSTTAVTTPVHADDESVILTWRGVQSNCQQAEISLRSYRIGGCNSEWHNSVFSSMRAATLTYYTHTFMPFMAETVAGTAVFSGTGGMVATPAQQRMIAELARVLVMDAQTGNAVEGAVFHWHREGGIAGFCDDIFVTAAGEIAASSCRSNPPQDLGISWLDADEASQFYEWLDHIQPFVITHEGPVKPDELVVTLAFTGTGSITPIDSDRQALLAFGQQLRNQAIQH